MLKYYKQRAMTMVDVLFVIVLLNILTIVVIRYFITVNNNAKIASTVTQVGQIAQAARSYVQSGVYPDMDNLVNAGLITSQQAVTAWGGEIDIIQQKAQPNLLYIRFKDVPNAACNGVSQQLNVSLTGPDNGASNRRQDATQPASCLRTSVKNSNLIIQLNYT